MQFDYEGELALIIGQRARHVSEDYALNVVAGYSCFAENSARDFQRHSQQVTAGKNFDRSGAFVPWLVTPDGVGVLRKPPVFLKPDDRLEVEISGIGTLANALIAEVP